MLQNNLNGVGGFHVSLIHSEAYNVSTAITNPSTQMLDSKSKRRNRRSDTVQMLEQSYSKGMDVAPPKFLTWRQEDFWNTMKKNTVTLAHGSAGTGKTLMALHFGLSGVASGDFEKVYYVRSDVGVEYQRGRGALPGDMSDKIAPLVAPIFDNLPCIMRSQGAAEYLLNKKSSSQSCSKIFADAR